MSDQLCEKLAAQTLSEKASESQLEVSSAQFAALLDAADPIGHLRSEFHIPKIGDLQGTDGSVADLGQDCVYFCGNSLGLQPKGTRELISTELDKWAKRGVQGHHDDSARPWVTIEETVAQQMTAVVGANTDEVIVMNTLSVNLHLLMVPFYRPTPKRFKILMEVKAFPSDYLAVVSQIKFHGYDPATALIEVSPRDEEATIRDTDIIDIIHEQGDSIALVLLGAVQYYTGQFFDVEKITQAAHEKGCYAGFDCAHAAGNIPLRLHDWDVDFACWCSYKYLNSGPGSLSGAFMHRKHADNKDLPRFAGWWGVDLSKRFAMKNEFDLVPGIRSLQLSNPPVLETMAILGSMNVYTKTTMKDLRAKSEMLTGYLELLLNNLAAELPEGARFRILTPKDPARRGCQLSVMFDNQIAKLHHELERRGIVCDKREPNVLRFAPVPLYNTFFDVQRFVQCLRESIAVLAQGQ